VHRKARLDFAADVISALEGYAYPGNVRELRNIVERAVISALPPLITVDDLPLHVRQAVAPGGPRKMTLEELERAYIAEILDYARGKKGRAAEILGISRKTLLEKRRRYHLD
jgi:DNA-binding NtrC family response regulator